jgi:DNA gyrase subunit A
MDISRPDLSQIPQNVREYIEALESELEVLRAKTRSSGRASAQDEESPVSLAEPSEPPTTINVINFTQSGVAKRTPRHLYTRQRRSGMGVFDLDTGEDDPPAILAIADQSENLLVLTVTARAFRLPVTAIQENEIHSHGASITTRMSLQDGERLAAVLPDRSQGYVALLSERGNVRLLRHHVFGEYMKPGTPLYDFKAFGRLASACWTPGDGELFIATRQGRAIRFSEKLIPPQGAQGIRLAEGDVAVGITAVYPESEVFLLASDGKGTIRRMEGFNANKAPGAGGKIAMNTDELVAAFCVNEPDDIFIVSRLSKIIRFQAAEVPSKEAVVQGVNCMSLRADKCAAAIPSPVTNVF